MTTRSPMHSWIRSWLKRNDNEFEEEAARQRERDQATAGGGVAPDVLQMCAQLDLDRHRRNQFPVGVFFDHINPERHNGRKPTAEQLMVVAETGTELLYAAICAADDEDNEEFFVQAYEHWGPLVDTVLQECGCECRNSLTGTR